MLVNYHIIYRFFVDIVEWAWREDWSAESKLGDTRSLGFLEVGLCVYVFVRLHVWLLLNVNQKEILVNKLWLPIEKFTDLKTS